jgi:uncharacterized membrane protein
MADTPILPAHIEDTVRAIAKLHADHRLEAGPLQRAVDRATGWFSQPRFIATTSMVVALWILTNSALAAFGAAP